MTKGGRYIFLEATDEEKAQAEMLAKGLDGKPKTYWRLEELIAESPHFKRFKVYHEELIKFNVKINLVSKKSIYNADIVHFLDSFVSGQKILEDSSSEIIYDLGSGNGFPGLIMAILDQNRKFVLVDSDNRKVEFLKYMATKLALKNVAAHCADISKIKVNSINCAVSRGLGSLTKSLLLSNKSFTSGSSYYHLKGPLWPNELGEIPSQLLTAWKPELLFDYQLPKDHGDRFVIKTKHSL